MKFNKLEWNGPTKVETPNIEIKADIGYFLGDKVYKEWKNSTDKELNEKLILITERLEFICHLKSIANIVQKNSTNYINSEGKNILECVVFGHDYGGLEYDIEALNYYLYLTCIDAIQTYNKPHGESQKNFVKAFVEDISPNLKNTIYNTLIVVEAKKQDIMQESIDVWNEKTEKEKLETIANKLYQLRCSFTHENIRSF